MEPLLLPVDAETLVTAAQMVLGFTGALFLGARFLPGLERVGYPQPDGTRKRYTLTGMTSFFLLHVVGAIAVLGFGVSLTPIVRHFASLAVVAVALSVALSLGLYAWGHRAGPVCRSREGDDFPLPRPLRELWFGNECNPDWAGVDLKMFLYQPSQLGVYVLVLSFAFAQWERHGVVTPQMACLCGFWFVYLFSHFVKEEFMLSTWDVIAENLGFMLVWGDLFLVPFFYCLPGWWMVDATEPFAPSAWISLVVFYSIALVVFRQANWQKERFKQDPSAPIWGRPPRVIAGRLLASGYWGIGRKINYTGELGVFLAFALCAGFVSPWPYALPLWLLGLLSHRAWRDERRCRAKYGAAWQEYTRVASFRIVPFVY